MKLLDTIILSLSVVFFIIGVHQTMILGLTHSYWIFMLSVGLLLFFQLRKKKQTEEEPKAKTVSGKSKKKK